MKTERIETEYPCINDPDIWLPPEVGDEEDDVDHEVISEKLKTLLKNIVTSTEKYGYNWVDLITSLLRKVSNFPKGEVMDPDCYVKVKCLAIGSPSQRLTFHSLYLLYILVLFLFACFDDANCVFSVKCLMGWYSKQVF